MLSLLLHLTLNLFQDSDTIKTTAIIKKKKKKRVFFFTSLWTYGKTTPQQRD